MTALQVLKELKKEKWPDLKTGEYNLPLILAAMHKFSELCQCNVSGALPSLPSDKYINEKAKIHQQQFPNNLPMRSYKTGYHHALHDIEKAMPS